MTVTRTTPQSVEHFMALEERLKITRCRDESAQMYSGTSSSMAVGIVWGIDISECRY